MSSLIRGVTLRGVERILRVLCALGKNLPETERPQWWRFGGWQEEITTAILDHEMVIIQGPRQATGKSYCVALVAVVFLILGYRVIVAMPSLRQGSRILLRRIESWMLVLEPAFGLRRTKDDALEKAWNNGAGLMALSTNEAAEKGVQGYTGALLIIDEAHEASMELYGAIRPLVSVALRAGYGKVLASGVGGPLTSPIEQLKSTGDFYISFWDDERILARDPSWSGEFAAARRQLSPDDYDKYYRCLPSTAGIRLLFPGGVPPLAEPRLDGGWDPVNAYGIDVGKRRDYTVVRRVQRYGECRNLLEPKLRLTGTKYPEQARQIKSWIKPQPHDVARIYVELPGPGDGLVDIFNDPERPVWWGIQGMPITYDLKKYLIGNLERDMRRGVFGVESEQDQRMLGALTMEVDDKGKYAWEHSDELSALLMAELAIG